MATVLIVDDIDANREVLKSLLGPFGHRLLEAGDGAEALASARAHRPDLVITDILMPGMDGYRFVQSLRGDPELAATEVIFYTATYSAPDAEKLARSCGVSVVLPKPSEPRLILRAVNRLLGLPEPLALSIPAAPPEQEAARGPAGERFAGRPRPAQVARLIPELISQRDPARMLEALFDAASRLVPSAVAALAVLEADQARARHLYSRGVPAAALAPAVTRGLFAKVLAEGRPLRLCAGQLSPADLPPEHPPAGGVLAAPILTGTRGYGWLYLARPPGAEPFDEDDAEVLAALAANGAVLYENIQLYDLLQRHAVQLQLESAERARSEMRLQRLNRVRAVLSGINALIVRARTREALFEGSCRIAVEQGQFRLAWIGLLQGDELRPAAFHGEDGGYLKDFFVSLSPGGPGSEGPTARALREVRPVASNDVARDEAVSPRWREACRTLGYNSYLAHPLKVGGAVMGCFGLHAPETGFFDEEELKLLGELAADIAYALEFIARDEQLDYLAYYDPLTRLANRRLFAERLSRLLAGARKSTAPLALLEVDVDHFKSINDTFGQPGGDAVLQQLAERLVGVAGDPGRVGRLPGDRFVLAIPDLPNAAELDGLLQKELWDRLGRPMTVAGQELRISAKAGLALFPDDGEDAESLLRNAEAALKHARSAGLRYARYTPEIGAQVGEKLRLEVLVRRALERGEFALHYQPKVDLKTGAVCGAEALIRWNNPERGAIAPLQFIPLIEETGQILEVGRWVLQQAAADRGAWARAGVRSPRLSVNVSQAQLLQTDFVDVVKGVLAEQACAPADIELEITESMLMMDARASTAKLLALRDLGVSVVMDDFGTGYSSLSALSQLPLSAIKIDRSFVAGMAENAGTMTIVSAIITLAHSLKLKVIAEGVESQDQLKYLRLLRCDEIQGHLFSKALPADEFARLLLQGKRLGY